MLVNQRRRCAPKANGPKPSLVSGHPPINLASPCLAAPCPALPNLALPNLALPSKKGVGSRRRPDVSGRFAVFRPGGLLS